VIAMDVVSTEDYLQRSRSLSREAFVATYPYPVLIRGGARGAKQDTSLFGTIDAKSWEHVASKAEQEAKPDVLRIVKRQSVFEGMITCGRTKNNDVVIPEVGVSKFHAWFADQAGAGNWCVADAKSMNGTFLNGRRLDPDKPEPVKDGDRVSFSLRVDYLFHTAGGFYDALKNLG